MLTGDSGNGHLCHPHITPWNGSEILSFQSPPEFYYFCLTEGKKDNGKKNNFPHLRLFQRDF